MGSYRDEWREAKETAEKDKNFVLSDETKKMDLGPHLDKFEAAVKLFHANHDAKKTEALTQAVLDEQDKANVALTSYMNALKGIVKARPQQAEAAKKLLAALKGIEKRMGDALKPASQGTYRDMWRAAKAEAERDKDFVLSDECKKTDLGPHLDKFQAAMKAYGDNKDDGKEDKVKQTCQDEFKKTNDAMKVYVNALNGIQKARPQQAEAAKKLNQILSNIGNQMTAEMRPVAGRRVR